MVFCCLCVMCVVRRRMKIKRIEIQQKRIVQRRYAVINREMCLCVSQFSGRFWILVLWIVFQTNLSLSELYAECWLILQLLAEFKRFCLRKKKTRIPIIILRVRKTRAISQWSCWTKNIVSCLTRLLCAFACKHFFSLLCIGVLLFIEEKMA